MDRQKIINLLYKDYRDRENMKFGAYTPQITEADMVDLITEYCISLGKPKDKIPYFIKALKITGDLYSVFLDVLSHYSRHYAIHILYRPPTIYDIDKDRVILIY